MNRIDNDEWVLFEGLEQDSEEWLKWRKKGLGSSDISLIMSNERQFDRDLITLWRDRTGIEPHPFVENEHTKRGKELEPMVRDAVNGILGTKYQPLCAVRGDAPYLKASLDGYDESTNSILEIKCPSDKVFNKYLAEWSVPLNYMYQMQYQMLVASADYGWFSFFNSQVGHPKLIFVEANIEMQTEIERRSSLVWHAIEHKIPIGFVDGVLTLMPPRPKLFVCVGGAEPPFPVEKRTSTKSHPHSFCFSVKNKADINKVINNNKATHEIHVIAEGAGPFGP